MSEGKSETTAAATVTPGQFAAALLSEIEAEINDRRTDPGERVGLMLAHVIVRRTAESMGVEADVR